MAYDAYMKIAGIEGESTAKGNEKEVAVQSFTLRAENPTTVSAGTTGLSASRVSLSGFDISKPTDKASVPLFIACCKGKHIDEITVTLRKSAGDGGQSPFLVYKFTNCLVRSIDWQGHSGNNDDSPLEVVSIAFEQIEVTYSQQDTKGGAVGKPVVGAWNLATLDGK